MPLFRTDVLCTAPVRSALCIQHSLDVIPAILACDSQVEAVLNL